MKIKTDHTFTLFVEKLVAGGTGFTANVPGVWDKAIFIQNAVPGDELEVRITKDKKKFSQAEIIRIIKASQERVNPPCPYYGVCGGCQLQHVSEKLQEQFPTDVLKNNLNRIAKVENVKDIVQNAFISKNKLAYRIKGNFKFAQHERNIHFGFYKEKSHSIVNIEACMLMQEPINALFNKLKQHLKGFQDAKTPPFSVDIIITKEAAAIFYFTNKNTKFFNHIKDFQKKNSLDYLEIKLGKKTIHSDNYVMTYAEDKLLPGSFVQINPEVNAALKDFIIEHADLSSELLDVYCGYGNLSLPFSRKGSKVTGIENSERATHCLKDENNYKIITGQVKQELQELIKNKNAFSTVILDPPRTGAFEICEELINLNPKKIIYVSCDSATLSRDILKLTEGGYSLTIAKAFNMFPQTAHTESVAVLERN